MSDCVYCGAPAGTRDHVVPLSRGGRGAGSGNVVPACRPCNALKADRAPAEFFCAYPERAREFVARAPLNVPFEMIVIAHRAAVDGGMLIERDVLRARFKTVRQMLVALRLYTGDHDADVRAALHALLEYQASCDARYA